ncbi:MAG: helix-turn-helix domain-containing protein [Raineya sp.]|nr:helix-turn-helix domain-containing protein [Raineya sp.]
MQEILNRIKKERISKNIKQSEMAKLVNMTQGGYSKIEIGATDLSVNMLFQIADALGVSVQYLLFGEKQPQDTNEKDRKIKELEKDLEILKMKIERQNILLEIYASLFEKIDDKERKKAFEELPKESKAAILILLGTEFIDWLINREKK